MLPVGGGVRSHSSNVRDEEDTPWDEPIQMLKLHKKNTQQIKELKETI